MTIQDHLSRLIIRTERGAFTVVRGPIYTVQCIEICVHSMICLGRYCSDLPLPSAGCSAHQTRAGLRHRYPGRTKCPLAERINHPASVSGLNAVEALYRLSVKIWRDCRWPDIWKIQEIILLHKGGVRKIALTIEQ